MRYIANVLLPENGRITYDKYVKRCYSMEETENNIPTLIIGYEKAKQNIKNYSILKKWYPEQNLYWTFGKRERRNEYDDDIEIFYDMVIKNIYANVTYEYINPLFIKYSGIKTVLSLLRNLDVKAIYNNNDKFLFIYDRFHKKVYGISLDMCEYIGINKDKIKNRVKECPNVKIFTDITFLNKKLREIMYKKQYLIPVFYDYFKC